MIDKNKFAYSPFEKVLEKQIKVIENQEEKQIKAIKNTIRKQLFEIKVLDKKKIILIFVINHKNGYNNLRCKYKSAQETNCKKDLVKITNPIGFFNKIKTREIALEKAKSFRCVLKEIQRTKDLKNKKKFS